jgi:hypothetical protein
LVSGLCEGCAKNTSRLKSGMGRACSASKAGRRGGWFERDRRRAAAAPQRGLWPRQLPACARGALARQRPPTHREAQLLAVLAHCLLVRLALCLLRAALLLLAGAAARQMHGHLSPSASAGTQHAHAQLLRALCARAASRLAPAAALRSKARRTSCCRQRSAMCVSNAARPRARPSVASWGSTGTVSGASLSCTTNGPPTCMGRAWAAGQRHTGAGTRLHRCVHRQRAAPCVHSLLIANRPSHPPPPRGAAP